jgi:hypothetical protein
LCIGLGAADRGGRIGLPIAVVAGDGAEGDGKLFGAPAAVGALGVGGRGDALDLVEEGGGPSPIWVASVDEGRLGIEAAGL